MPNSMVLGGKEKLGCLPGGTHGDMLTPDVPTFFITSVHVLYISFSVAPEGELTTY